MKVIGYLFAAILCITSFGSCSKKKNTTASDQHKAGYSLKGLSDITITESVDTTIELFYDVKADPGTQEPVTVSIAAKNLPAGVVATPDSLTGTPPFSVHFTLHAMSFTSGTSPVVLNAVSKSGTKVTDSFHLTIVPFTELVYTVAIADVTREYSHYAATIDVPLTITYVSGTKQTLTIRQGTVPSGVTLTPAVTTSMPDLVTSCRIYIPSGMPVGKYNCTISTSHATGGKSAPFYLSIVPYTGCTGGLIGDYATTTTTCTSYTGSETGVHFQKIGTGLQPDQLTLYTPFGMGYNVTLDCSVHTIANIGSPLGYGTFTDYPSHDTVIFTYNPTGTGTCTTRYMR